MLVLTRRPQEEIIIELGSDRITLKVLKHRGNVIRLGIDAPRELPILRGELQQPADEEVEAA